MNKDEIINSLKRNAFKSHPLNIEKDAVSLDFVMDLIEEMHTEQKLNKHSVMQGCQCKDRIGETKVWCCNQCGLPCEDGWLPTHKAIRQPTVASEGLGEANTSAGFCSCATPNDCKDLTNCALYNRKRG